MQASHAATRSRRPKRGIGWVLTMILALVLLVAGGLLFAGGIWLITLGGSWYYAIAGAGVLLTSILMLTLSAGAVWIYIATYLFTVGWAFWEVGLEPWAQVPRLVGPTLILILVLLTIPVLRRRAFVEDVDARAPVEVDDRPKQTPPPASAPTEVPAREPVAAGAARRANDPAAAYSGDRQPIKGVHG